VFPGINPNLAAMSIRPSAPLSPIISTITYTATQATVFVSPPEFNGGAIINFFNVVDSPGSVVQTILGPNGGSTLYSGLTPNTNYTFIAYAINEIGTGTAVSSAIKTLTDISLAPTGLVASALSSTRAAVSYTQPTSNNGSAITSYTAISNPGQITASTFTSVSSLIIISGLTTATSYLFQIYATNGNGNSPTSIPSNQITTFSTAPWAPVIGTAVYVSGITATVSFTASPYNGGSVITSYTAVSTPLGLTSTFSGAGSGSMTFNNLTVPNNYTFVVYATNAIGNSPNSAASNSINATGSVPDAPTSVVASVLSPTSASISYVAPAFNGGRTITSYTATSVPDGRSATVNTAASGNITVTGLTPATSYYFNVYATNAIGNSNVVSSNTISTPARAPDAPTMGTATYLGNKQISISFTAPTYNGGSTILSYTAVSSPGNITATLSGSGSGSITVSGLLALTSYTFVIYATNVIGNSANSAASNSVLVPATVPGAPTITGVSLTGAAAVTITYTAPADNGGTAITGYTAVSTPGSITKTVASGNILVTGLTAATSYYFNVYATNSVGNSANSANSAYVATWGSILFTGGAGTTFTNSWKPPLGVTSVSVVVVGSGATSSAAASQSYFKDTATVAAGGSGQYAYCATNKIYKGGTVIAGAGGKGGCSGFVCISAFHREGGGGAGGYAGAGGYGARSSYCGASGGAGAGGGGGGGDSNLLNYAVGAGGGVGVYGQGANGAAGSGGGGGSGGCAGTTVSGGNYGGGAKGRGGAALAYANNIAVCSAITYTLQAASTGGASAGAGAVRIVWPAASPAGNRTFPSTNVSTP